MEKQFTRGNLVSIVATLLTGGVILTSGITFLNKTDAKANANTQAITRFDDRLDRVINRVEGNMSSMQTSITSLQVASARTIAQYDSLSASLNEVKTSLREISTLLRGDYEPAK